MNFKDVLKFNGKRVIVLDDNEYGIELVAFSRFPTDWFSARKRAKDLDICGYRDWKIPTIKELESIVNQCSFEEILSMSEIDPSLSERKLRWMLWSSDCRKDSNGRTKEIYIYDYKKKKTDIINDGYLGCCYIRYTDN